jgi:hypothetical protein
MPNIDGLVWLGTKKMGRQSSKLIMQTMNLPSGQSVTNLDNQWPAMRDNKQETEMYKSKT